MTSSRVSAFALHKSQPKNLNLKRIRYIFAIIASPKPEQLTNFEPGINRSKS